MFKAARKFENSKPFLPTTTSTPTKTMCDNSNNQTEQTRKVKFMIDDRTKTTTGPMELVIK